MSGPARITNNQTDGLRAVCAVPEPLHDLCHHADYSVYVNGQYVESAGSLGANVDRALAFYRRKSRNKTVEARPGRCRVPGCTWGRS